MKRFFFKIFKLSTIFKVITILSSRETRRINFVFLNDIIFPFRLHTAALWFVKTIPLVRYYFTSNVQPYTIYPNNNFSNFWRTRKRKRVNLPQIGEFGEVEYHPQGQFSFLVAVLERLVQGMAEHVLHLVTVQYAHPLAP